MKFEIQFAGLGQSWCARAGLAVSLLAALVGCNVQQASDGAHAQIEVTKSAVVASSPAATWPEFPTLPRHRHAGVELGAGRALVCGGKNDTEVYPPSCELLEIHEGSLTATAYSLPGEPLAQGRINPTLTLLPTGGVLLVGGRPGANNLQLGARASIPLSSWQPDTGTPNPNWLPAETLNVAREEHTATLLGSSVVIVGGYNRLNLTGTVPQIEVRASDAAPASWQVIGPSEPRQGHSATLLKPAGGEARVLVVGGYDTVRGGYLKSGFILSLESGLKAIADMPFPRAYHTATLLDDDHGSVLVVGGASSADPYIAQALRYDPVTDEWRSAGGGGPTLPVPRKLHAAARLASYVVVAGGEGPGIPGSSIGQALQSVQTYDFRQDAFHDVRSLSKGREYFQLLKLGESQLVASGGLRVNGNDSLSTSELITLSSLGEPASDAAACASGFAADGVCCESACDGACQACDAEGTCQKVSGAPANGHPVCAGDVQCVLGACPVRCDATNLCRPGFFCEGGHCAVQKSIGIVCNSGAECAGGAPCVDHVCCDSPCTGSCEACNQEQHPGICLALEKGATPLPSSSHPPCSIVGDHTPDCAPRCDGVTRDRCELVPGPEVVCGSAACESGNRFRPPGACDGEGSCQVVAADCTPYACDAKALECPHSCQKSETDCVGGYYCNPVLHRCVPAPVAFPNGRLSACALGTPPPVGHASLAVGAASCLLLLVRRRSKRSRTRS